VTQLDCCKRTGNRQTSSRPATSSFAWRE